MAQTSKRQNFCIALTLAGLLLGQFMYRWCITSPFAWREYGAVHFSISCIFGLLPLLAVLIKGRGWHISLGLAEFSTVVCTIFLVIWVRRAVDDCSHFAYSYGEEILITVRQRKWFYTVVVLNLCASAVATATWLTGIISMRLHRTDVPNSEKVTYAVRLLPCSAWNAPALVKWFQQQAERGLYFRTSLLGIAIFAHEKHDRVRYALYDAPDVRVVSRGYTYAGRIGHGFCVFMTESDGICRLSAYTLRTKLRSAVFTGIFVIFIFLEAVMLHYIIASAPYNTWLSAQYLQWEQLLYTFHLIFNVAFTMGLLPGFLPICRKNWLWLGRLRRAVAGLSLVLFFAVLLWL